MKRFFFFICALVLLCNLSSFAAVEWDGTSAPWTKGTGTETDPYLIETPQQLSYLSEMVSAGINTYKGKYFKQTQDFDMKSFVFTPIGISAKYPFEGNYNGEGKRVSNLKISGDNDNDYIALFGYAVGATIDKVFVDGSFSCTYSGRKYAASVLAFGKNVKLYNCQNRADIKVECKSYAAGIVALLSGTCNLVNCSNVGVISSFFASGGIVGENDIAAVSTLTNCSNTGLISSNGLSVSGGMGGGILGINSKEGKIILSHCSNTGSIVSASSGRNFFSCAGGCVASNMGSATMTTCSNRGDMSVSSSGAYASGIVGFTFSEGSCKINNCYAHCAISVSSASGHSSCSYGITNNAIISNCYFVGELKGTNLFGISQDGSVTNSYFNSDCGASTSGKGTAKMTTQLKSASMPILLNGSEIGTIWTMDVNDSNDGYPILGWQVPVATYKITATCDELQGSVNGGGNYTEGTIVTLTATPKEGYIFLGWSDGDKTNPRSVTVGTSDVTYTALFVKMRYVITVNQDCSVNVQ